MDNQNYDALSEIQLILLAEKSFGIVIRGPILDDNAARLVRNKIAELGLIVEWQHELALACGPVPIAAIWWMVVQAPPRLQMVAALKAKDGANE